LAAQSPEMFNPDLGGMETTAARMLVLNGMIDDLLLMQEAGVEGISVSDSDVQERIDARIITFPSTEAFEEELAINGLTPQLFREQTRHAMIFVALMEHLVPTDSVSDQEVYDYYHENVDLYTEFAAKRTSHILLPLTDEARGEELLEELQASRNLEEDFAAAAQEYSIDVSNADLGGDADLPRVPDHRHPDYIEAIDDLDVGELSELIRTEVGYFIILVTDERSETVRSLEEVSPGIRDMKLNTLRNEMRTNLVERLRGEADIEILDSAILDAQERGEIFLGNDADVDAYDAANLGEENPPAEDPVLEEE
ncbi:MAG: peptidyl-prolyl cis-trans isomerase, partial [Coriobacteriia bacterium]|nr:peptidyl-prolyl cis-trans isomerase [Coriobacteriia bacterium]